MYAKVKNMLEKYERSKNIITRKRRFTRIGRRRPAPIHRLYQELKYIIISRDDHMICPKRWEELEVDFENIDSRYCSVCNEKVIKVANQHNFDELHNSNSYIALPLNGKLYRSLSEDLKGQADKYIFLQVSRMMLCDAGYGYDDIIHSNHAEEILKMIFYELEDGVYIRRFTKECKRYGVDFVEILGLLKK